MAVRLSGESAEAVGGRCCQIMWAMLIAFSTAVSSHARSYAPAIEEEHLQQLSGGAQQVDGNHADWALALGRPVA